MQRMIAKLERDARNEIHSIMGMLELVADGPLTDLQYQHLRACRSSAHHLLRSVQNIYQLICAETSEPTLSNFDLQHFVADIVGLMEDLAKREGLSFKVEIRAGTPARVTGDRHRLENILVRLIDNAIKFTDKGWIQLIVAKCENYSDSSCIEFIVCDSGRGIPQDTITRVLDPAALELGDNGLGIAIVHQLVSAIGGELSISPQDGGGSRVTVSLPFATLDDPASPIPSDADHTQRQTGEPVRPLNILIAEDSEQSYYVIESYLDGQGYRLTRAQNGASAVEKFKNGGYDLVLMDVHMPVMDGYAATRAIREWETTDGRARVPIVVLSSDSAEIQRENGAKAGCSGYITKPASKAAVLRCLKRFERTVFED
jgi:CheY-like chemotaxis protein